MEAGEEEEEHEQLDFERHPIAEDFFEALECLRISPSQATLSTVREKAAVEFETICEEHGLLDALSAMGTSDVSDTEIGQNIAPQEVVREIAVKRKQRELNALRETLLKIEDDSATLSNQLESLQLQVAEAQHLQSFTEKVSGINVVIQKAVR